MGIGAYEAREFIRSLGGQLDVQSELGVGSCFRMQLPMEARSESKLELHGNVDEA